MKSPIDASDFANSTPGQQLCDAFGDKLLNNGKIQALLAWLLSDQGGIGSGFMSEMLQFISPIGSLMHSPIEIDDTNPDDGAVWLLADGKSYLIEDYPRLAAIYGSEFNEDGDDAATHFRVPKLNGRFLLTKGSSETQGASSHQVGEDGGEEKHTMLETEIAAHSHTMADHFGPASPNVTADGNGNDIFYTPGTPTASLPLTVKTDSAGGSSSDPTPLDIMPPYFTVATYVLAGFQVRGVMV